MAKTDGEILINTKIQTDEAKEDLKDLEKSLKETADSASESNKKIESSADEMVSSLPESYRTAYKKIEQIRADDALDSATKADRIAEQFMSIGQSAEDAMAKAWGSIKHESESGAQIVIDNLEEIKQEATQAGKTMSSIGSGMGGGGGMGNLVAGVMGGLTSTLVQAGMDMLKQAGQAVVDFGKESVELASDLQEVQNVVDVIFTTMSDDVDGFARNAIKSAGMSETMAKKYVGTFGAMADSFGFTEAEAYDMATSLTQLTGDVSSFYNLDHDEANTKLKAVFTGETEALKELGVVMTQTALDQFALENGFGKTTKEMTEQEKVSLRYKFVMDKLSNASGDFVRTQDSWANQTKILSEQWEAFQTSIGEGLLEIFTPSVKFLNDDVMPALLAFGDWFSDILTDDPAEELAEGFDKLSDSMEETITKADGTVASYADVQAAIEGVEASVSTLKQEYEEAKESAKESLNSQIGLLTELETKSDKTAREIVDNWKKQQSALNQYAFNLQKAISMGLDRALVKQLSDGSQESMLILNELVNGTGVSIAEINREFQNVQQSKEIVASTMADVQTDMSNRLDAISRDVKNEWGYMADEVGYAIYEMQQYINSLQGKTVYIDLQSRDITASSSAGWTSPAPWSNYSLEPEYVPQLATGAVIPPNAPFTAVLGDQRNGYNLEGPEDMFRSIVREEIEAASGNETNELLADILAAINNAKFSVNESGVFQIVVEQNDIAVRTYGQSPLR